MKKLAPRTYCAYSYHQRKESLDVRFPSGEYKTEKIVSKVFQYFARLYKMLSNRSSVSYLPLNAKEILSIYVFLRLL